MGDAVDASEMSISELRRALESRGIDYRDCIEKAELVERLTRDRRDEDAIARSVIMEDRRSSGEGDVESGGGLALPEKRLIALFERCGPSVAFIATSVAQQRGTSQLSLSVEQDVINVGQAMVTLGNHTRALSASLVGVEPEKDIAVLKVEVAESGADLVPIAIGSSADLQVGQSVAAIGCPFGLDNTLTTGIVSALGREVAGVGGRPITGCVQTDAAINPGNSGGPLLDSSGRLIGVNTSIVSPGGASVGIGFAIPVDTVRRVVNQIIRHGRVPRPTLGIQVADDQILRDLSRRVGRELPGVLVMSVAEGTPASRAGIRATLRGQGGVVIGDIIQSVAGHPTRQVEELLSVVESQRVGDVVEVEVLRGVGRDPHTSKMRLQLVERREVTSGSRSMGRRRSAGVDVNRSRM